MIISHKRKFIFIKTTKVAGTSLEIALSKFCGKDDVITALSKEEESFRKTRGFRSSQNFQKSFRNYNFRDFIDKLFIRNPVVFYEHMAAEKIKNLLPDDQWNNYLKFTIVRNPFDYAVSRYYWNRSQGRTNASFENFLFENPQTLVLNRNIYMINGESNIDFFIRYENLENDLKKLSDILELDENIYDVIKSINVKANKKPKNKNTKQHFEDFQDGINLINILCKYELEKFGYRLG